VFFVGEDELNEDDEDLLFGHVRLLNPNALLPLFNKLIFVSINAIE